MVNNTTYGIASNGTPTNYTVGYNATYGNTSGHTSNVTNSNSVVVNPYLDSQGRPTGKTPTTITKGGILLDGAIINSDGTATIGAQLYDRGLVGVPGKLALSIAGGPIALGKGGRIYEPNYSGNYFLDGSILFLDGSTYSVDGGL